MLIRWIDETDFLPLMNSSLEALDLSSCMVTVIEEAAFKPLTSLSSLNMSLNPMSETAFRNMSYSLHIESLREFLAEEMTHMSYFSAAFLYWLRGSNIESLYLSRNRLVSFPVGNYPKLRVLELIRCNVVLRDDAFIGMPNLEFLTVKEHEVPVIGSQFLTNRRLKILDLSNYIGLTAYSLFEIKDYAFKNQINLEVLYLSYLPIRKSIRRHTFSGLVNLRKLILSSGFVELIEERAFEDLNSLIHLDMSYHLISTLSNETFFGLKSVKNIDLRGNEISFLNDIHPFLQTPNLEILTLNSNKIINIPGHIFLNLSYISVIQAADNLIQPWKEEMLPKSSNISALIVAKNRITHFTREMFNDVKQLEFFDFSENPINCSSCSTTELQKWMNQTNISISRLYIADEYACKEPSSLEGVYILDANLSSVLTHCLPVEYDIAKVLYCTFVPLFMLGFIAAFVWHQWKWNIRYFIFLARSRARRYKAQVTADRYAFDAFISYCEKDLPWIRKELVPNIEDGEPTIRLCLPDRNFDAAHSTMDNVAAAIEHSRTTVLVLSNEYMDSNWCRFDMEMAQHKLFEDTRSGLILILLEAIHKCKMTKNLQYVIRTRTCIAWTNNLTGQKLFWERLRAAIMKPEDKGILTHIT
ncbi:Toll-like receptor 13, partial [Stegodyphus mimosarum]